MIILIICPVKELGLGTQILLCVYKRINEGNVSDV